MNDKKTSAMPHRYEILDGLRGVAAMMVVVFHISEAFSYDPVYKHINHGFLAVDFFFVLSGFVTGYAYERRMVTGEMSFLQFMKSRLIRLQPMVLFGLLLGAMLFWFQASGYYPRIAETSVATVWLYVLLNFLMIPQTPGQNIRGNEELFSLNIPQWSLIYEYIANLLFGLLVWRMGRKGLVLLVAAFAVMLTDCALSLNCFGLLEAGTYPLSLNAGFTWNAEHIYTGMARVGYSFFAGLLLFRCGCLLRMKAAFTVCSLAIVAVICAENVGGYEHPSWDGAYNLICTLAIFPLLVSIGAGSTIHGEKTVRLCRFLGRISYPLYLVHYPLVYLFFSWIYDHRGMGTPVVAMASASVFLLSVALAWGATVLYDEPVRKWLKKHLDGKKDRTPASA